MTSETKLTTNAPVFRSGRARVTRPQQLTKLLSRKSGASIAQIQNAFGWQPHSARAALSALRKAGTEVVRTDTEKGPVYRIASGA